MSDSIARSTLQYLPAQLFGPFILFGTTLIWTHLLDPASFGVVAFVVAAQELTGLIGLTWWSIFVVRFQSRHTGHDADKFRNMDAFMVASSVLVQIALAGPVLLWIGVTPHPDILLATMAFLATRTLLSHYSEWSRSLNRVGNYTIAQVAVPFIGSTLSVFGILTLRVDVSITLSAMALGQMIGLVAVMKGLGLSPRLGKFDSLLFERAFRYGLPLIASGVLLWAAVNGIRALVEFKDGIIGLGLFSVGWGLGQRLAVVPAMLCTAAAFPLAVNRLESGDRAGALRQVSINGVLMIGLLAPALAGVATLARPFVEFLVAEQYRSVTIAILPMAMATGAARMLRIHTVDQTGLLLERTGSTAIFNLVDVIFTLSSGAVGVWFGGVVGAALGCLCGTCIASILAIIFAVREMDLSIPWTPLFKVLSATAVMTLVICNMPPVVTPLQLCIHVAVGALVYSVSIFLSFREFRRGNINFQI